MAFFRTHKKDFFFIFVAFLAFLAFIPIFTYQYFASDLESKERIMNRTDTGVTLFDRNGQPFFNFYEAKSRFFTPISNVSDVVKESVIVAEDKHFYTNPGVSLEAIAGALIADIRHKDFAYGGSTITQQLVKI